MVGLIISMFIYLRHNENQFFSQKLFPSKGGWVWVKRDFALPANVISSANGVLTLKIDGDEVSLLHCFIFC